MLMCDTLGDDMDILDNHHGCCMNQRPLFHAIRQGNFEVVRYLVNDRGHNITNYTRFGNPEDLGIFSRECRATDHLILLRPHHVAITLG